MANLRLVQASSRVVARNGVAARFFLWRAQTAQVELSSSYDEETAPMRAVSAILLSAFLWPFLPARADVIVSGSVMTAGAQGINCSESGTAPSSFGLTCNGTNPATYATVSGQGDPFSGSVSLDVGVLAPEMPPFGGAQGSVQLAMNQEYLLTGGSGTATVNFVVDQPFNFPTTTMRCGFTFNGTPQMCDLGAGMAKFSETVQYGVPFTIGLDLGIDGLATNGFPEDGRITYAFNQSGLQATPEPSSALLLLPGLGGVLLVVRSRVRGKVARPLDLKGLLAAAK
jgi:hypothetical protein